MRRVIERQAFHAFNALWGVLAYHYLVPRGLAAAAIGLIAVIVGVIEVLRLRDERFSREIIEHPLFGRMIRPRELRRVSGAFWFVLGVALTIALFPKAAVEVACLAFGFGDAASAVVGRRYGTVRLGGGRTLQGSLAFVVAAFVAVLLFRMALYGGGAATALPWALVAAALGAAVELVSVRVDDNLTVPLSTAALLTLVVV